MRRNLDPQVWGPCAWQFLFDAAEACDAASGDAYRRFLELLPEVLPCAACRAHAAAYVRRHPVDVEALPAWLRAFREDVRRRKASGGQRVGERTPLGGGSSFHALALFLATALCVLVVVRWRAASR